MGKPGVFKQINNQDKSITPFKVYKSWGYSTAASIDADGIDRLVAIKPDPSSFSGKKVTLNTIETNNDTGSFLVNIANGKPASVIWYSLDHLYYKRAGKPFETFGNPDHSTIERTLFDEATVLSIPQSKIGETIKPGSVKLYLKNTQNPAISYLIDDGYGNLIDTELSASISGEILYLGFNNATYDNNWTKSVPVSVTRNFIEDVKSTTTVPELKITSKNTWITTQYAIPPGTNPWGGSAYFFDNSYIRIPNNEAMNFKSSNDYAVSFWTRRTSATISNDSYILSKRTTGTANVLSNQIITTGDVNVNAGQYPFEILYPMSTGIFTCRHSNGSKVTTLTGSINIDETKHVVLQKSGSKFQLYINGQKVGDTNLPTDGSTQNLADIFIGSLGIDANLNGVNGMRGAVDEFFIFNKALTQTEITQLSYTGSINLMSTNTNIVGNIFYEHGIVVVSDPRPKYGRPESRMFNDVVYNTKTSTSGSSYLDSIYLEFNSTVMLREHEYICKIKEDEFNFTSNPSIRIDNSLQSDLPKSFIYEDEFSPYVTTVGLYSKNGELLAIGKLATPIKKRDNVDLTIVVKFDA